MPGARKFITHVFPEEYTGAVHAVIQAPARTVYGVTVTLRWGPWVKKVRMWRVDAQGSALIFAKTDRDSVPLSVTSNKPLLLSAGAGYPDLPANRQHDHNTGWQRG